MIINSLCGCLCAYGLAGLRLSAHAVLLNLCITALQSMISIQLQARRPRPLNCPLWEARLSKYAHNFLCCNDRHPSSIMMTFSCDWVSHVCPTSLPCRV